MVIAVLEGRGDSVEQFGQPSLPARDRKPGQILSIYKQEIEKVEDQILGISGIRCCLDDCERCFAVRENPAKLAVEIRLLDRQLRYRCSNRSVFVEIGRASCRERV